MYILLVPVLLILIYIVYYKNVRNIPGPIPVPLIGSVQYYLLTLKSRDLLPLLRHFKNMYGDACQAYVFRNQYVALYHPKYAEGILSNIDHIKKGRSYQHLHPWLGDGLLTSTSERWKIHRKFLTPAFHFNILQNFLHVFLTNEKILVRKLESKADGRPVNLFPIIALTALDNVTEAIMGVSVNAQMYSDSEYVKSIETISSIIGMRMRNPVMALNFVFNLTPYKKRQDKALKVLHDQSMNMIEKRREELKNQNASLDDNVGIKNKHVFLDLLLLSDKDGKKMDIEHVQEEVDTFMFAGHDTTTSGVSFALFCISKSEEVQKKLLDEQKNILGADLTRDPTYAELKQMKYLEMVIKESLRLYPSVPLIERMITKDCEISGLILRKDSSIIVNIFEIQRHPDLFDEPLEFRPERFAATTTSNNAFSWLAFSAGPRNCIGQKFAMMELKVTIAAVIKKFKLASVNEKPILCADLILRSENGVKVAFSKRE